jgi:hypothetical protein
VLILDKNMKIGICYVKQKGVLMHKQLVTLAIFALLILNVFALACDQHYNMDSPEINIEIQAPEKYAPYWECVNCLYDPLCPAADGERCFLEVFHFSEELAGCATCLLFVDAGCGGDVINWCESQIGDNYQGLSECLDEQNVDPSEDIPPEQVNAIVDCVSILSDGSATEVPACEKICIDTAALVGHNCVENEGHPPDCLAEQKHYKLACMETCQ